MTLIDQLNWLTEIAPEVCQKAKFGRYAIGEYHFGERNNRFFAVRGSNLTYGRPALAWLRDALEGVIEARGWLYTIGYDDGYDVDIFTERDKYNAVSENSMTGALLAALLAALGEGKG